MDTVTLPDFASALAATLDGIVPLPPASIALESAAGLIAAREETALVDSPSLPCARRDGIALRTADTAGAAPLQPVHLSLMSGATAGMPPGRVLKPGYAVPIATGAPIPDGADAVLASEHCCWTPKGMLCRKPVPTGKNIFPQGRDVLAGAPLVAAGTLLTPAATGLLAAGGISTLKVFPKPRVAVLSTGSELVPPGKSLRPGQLYASNLVTLTAWLRRYPAAASGRLLRDDAAALAKGIAREIDSQDAVVISGGTLESAGDMTLSVLEAMGGRLVYRGVRMRPGKSTAMVWLKGKPVFCLPGGPPGCEMAFLQLALPAILKLGGHATRPFAVRKACLTLPLEPGRRYTRFLQARLTPGDQHAEVAPLKIDSRLAAQAAANAIIILEEGAASLKAGDPLAVQWMGFP